MLVVFAVIAVLIALLLPAMSKARAQARQLQCAAILRGWGQAFHAYAAMNKGRLPHSGDQSCNTRLLYRYFDDPLYPANSCGYTTLLPPLMGRKAWNTYNAYEHPTGDIWQCPAAVLELPDDIYAYTPRLHGYHTYVMNEFLDYDSTTPPPGYKTLRSFLNLADARQAAATLLMFEATLLPNEVNGQTGSGGASCTTGEYPHDGPGVFCERHARRPDKLGGNIMMLDGHVEWIDHLYDPTLPNPEMPPASDRRWWPY